jgi:hypothetical protein
VTSHAVETPIIETKIKTPATRYIEFLMYDPKT